MIDNVVYFIFRLLQPLFPKNTIITWDEIIGTTAEAIDGWTMFEWLKEHGYQARYICNRKSLFYSQNKSSEILGINPNKSIFRNCFWTMLRVRAVIKPFLYGGGMRNFFTDTKLKENKYIKDVYVDHGIVFFKDSAAAFYKPELTDTLIISNDFEKELYNRLGKWPLDKMKKGGLARWQTLKRQNSADGLRRVFIYFTWRGSLDLLFWEKRRKYEKNYHPRKSVYAERILHFLDNPELSATCKKYGIKLELGIHHAQIDLAGCSLFQFYSPHAEFVRMNDVSRHIRAADMMITDRSSIIFDAMFLNIPIAFWVPDQNDPMLNKTEHADEQHAIELQKKELYNYCDTEEALIKQIEKYAKNGFELEQKYQAINNTFFYYKTDICEHIMEAIDEN